jgi:hypothetical protein
MRAGPLSISAHPLPFVSEDDLSAFEGWLKFQAAENATPEERAALRKLFDEISIAPNSKVGLMKLRPIPGEFRYAVAVREGSDLWLTLWVRRNRKGEFFVMIPRGDRGWDPHTSYHLDGTLHMKSYERKFGPPQKRQTLSGPFRGAEHLGAYGGHGPKGVGAICDPSAFSGVVEVPSGVLDRMTDKWWLISWRLAASRWSGFQQSYSDKSFATSSPGS